MKTYELQIFATKRSKKPTQTLYFNSISDAEEAIIPNKKAIITEFDILSNDLISYTYGNFFKTYNN